MDVEKKWIVRYYKIEKKGIGEGPQDITNQGWQLYVHALRRQLQII